MDKEEALKYLTDLKLKIEIDNSFKGKSSLLKSIRKKIQFLMIFKCSGDDNLPELFVKEIERELNNIGKYKYKIGY